MHQRRSISLVILTWFLVQSSLGMVFPGLAHAEDESDRGILLLRADERRGLGSIIEPELQPGFQNADDRWLLQSPAFERLSSAARTYLLRKYGLLRRGTGVVQRLPAGRTMTAAAQLAPGGEIFLTSQSERLQSETCAAAFGPRLIVGYNDGAGTNDSLTGYSFSHDNGATWRQGVLPPYPSGGANFGDPVVAAGPNGEFYFSTLATNSLGYSTVGVARSDDGGRSWLPLVNASTTAVNSVDFQDKPWLAVDTTASPFRGNVYVSWTVIQGPESVPPNGQSFIAFARSTDGGRTWSAPRALSRRDRTFLVGFSTVAVGPAGEVYVAWFDAHSPGSAFVVAKSTDGGATFSRTVVALRSPRITQSLLNGTLDAGLQASLAVDTSGGPHDGTVYLAVHLVPEESDRGLLDVFLLRSTDGGTTWSPPLRVNDDVTPTDQWQPSVAVAPDGTVGVAWYDRRNDPVNNALIDVYLATSRDGGQTFSANRRVTTGNWLVVPTPLAFRPGYHGDYNQIAVNGTHFIITWGDERRGNPDAVAALVPLSDPRPAVDFVLSSQTTYRAIPVGGSAHFTLSLSAVGGFFGPIGLRASPEIPGVSFEFSRITALPGQPLTVRVRTRQDVEPGFYSVTVIGSNGFIERTTQIRFSVHRGLAEVPTPISPLLAPIVNDLDDAGFTIATTTDAEGTVHAVWEALNPITLNRELFYSRAAADRLAFSEPINLINRPDLDVGSPVIGVDASGRILVAYLRNDLTNPRDIRQDVALSISSDGGRTFGDPINVTRLATRFRAIEVAMAVEPGGAINLAWTLFDLSTGFEDVFFARSTDGGRRFSTPRNLSNTNSPVDFAFRPALAVDPAGGLAVSFTRVAGATPLRNVFFTRSTDGGATFSAPVNVTRVGSSRIAPAWVAPPSLFMDSDGDIVMVYTVFDQTRGEQEVYFTRSVNGGRSFSTPTGISRSGVVGGTALLPVVTVVGSTIFALWQETRTGDEEIFFAISTDGGQTFTEPANLSTSAGQSVSPAMTVDSRGRVLAFWRDDVAGATQIFVAAAAVP